MPDVSELDKHRTLRDSQFNLSYYRARYYDQNNGRFISEDPIEFLGGSNFYAYVENSPVDFKDELGLCQPSPKMQACLDKVFNEPTGGVKIQPKIDPKKGYTATTRKNLIIITIPCDSFLNDSNQVLEEYYHVLQQWNTGRLNKRKYGWEYLKHGYEKNKYEIEAKKFANDHQKEYEKCLSCGQ
jgi:RHS repeat-associated protein